MEQMKPIADEFMQNVSLDQDQIEKIWEQRSIQMAQAEVKEEAGEQLVVALIRLGRELLALEVSYVYDIRAKETLTRVPRVPEWVAGVTNLRGRILSVIDLRAYLNLPPSPQPAEGLLMVVQSSTMEVIFLVDDVPGIETLPVRHDLADDAFIHHLRAEYVQAVVERRDSPADQRHITVIDVEALLSDPRLVIHEDLS